jgi:hypothetical protein
MFVKLLTLLFSNVFVSFSVLVCKRSFNIKCSLRSLLVRSSAFAIKPKHDTIECIYTQAQEVEIEYMTTSTRVTRVALAPSLTCLCLGNIEAVECTRAH